MVDRRRGAARQRRVNKLVMWYFRRRGGRARFFKAPSLILFTKGRKTGLPRETPLLYLSLPNDEVALVASNGGDDRTPAWCLNLLAEPDVEAQIGSDRRRFTARLAGAEERRELWPRMVDLYSGYAKYQTKTEREIPIVLLTPRS
jgi:deazaflavin-dependent oxidoreductase (nitroreductase family)